MANLTISGYTFSTTPNPVSPAMKVVSGTETVYVNLTTSQRPGELSNQKVFTVSSTNYSFLRPFVTSNSLTGYSGVSNNSTATTGYSGVSNNSTATTGYAGVSSFTDSASIVDYYGGGTHSYSFVPSADYFNQVSYSGMTNWTTTSTKAYSGSHSMGATNTNTLTETVGYNAYQTWMSSEYFTVTWKYESSDSVKYDGSFLYGVENITEIHVSGGQWKTPKSMTIKYECSTAPVGTYAMYGGSISTILPAQCIVTGSIGAYYYNGGGPTPSLFSDIVGSYSESNSYFGAVKFSRSFRSVTYWRTYSGYPLAFMYRLTKSTLVEEEESFYLGPYLPNYTITRYASGYGVSSNNVSTSTSWFEVSETNYSRQSSERRSGSYLTWIFPYQSYSESSFQRTYSLSWTISNTKLQYSKIYITSQASYKNGVPITNTYTNSSSTTVSQQHWSIFATDTASSSQKGYVTSINKGNMSSITDLTQTSTRYSSSVGKGYLSSITDLTKTSTRYSSSTTVGNLSSTTELRTITSL